MGDVHGRHLQLQPPPHKHPGRRQDSAHQAQPGHGTAALQGKRAAIDLATPWCGLYTMYAEMLHTRCLVRTNPRNTTNDNFLTTSTMERWPMRTRISWPFPSAIFIASKWIKIILFFGYFPTVVLFRCTREKLGRFLLLFCTWYPVCIIRTCTHCTRYNSGLTNLRRGVVCFSCFNAGCT